MIKVGIVGLGKMGLLHLANCRFQEQVEVVAGVDPSKRSQSRARKNGLRADQLFDDYEKMFATKELDVAIVSLPNFLHADAVEAAAERGLSIFVEKPLARTVDECKRILNTVQRSGIQLMVDHNFRYLDCVEKMRELTLRGMLGDIGIATMEFIMNGPFTATLEPFPVPEWWFDPEKMGGGALMDLGYHLFDLYEWIFGSCSVDYAKTANRYDLPFEDTAIVVLESKGASTKGVINVGWFSKMIFPNFNFRLIFHGTVGFMSTDKIAPRSLYFHSAKEGLRNLLRRLSGEKIDQLSYTYYYASYVKSLRAFFDAVKVGADVPVAAEDGLKAVELVEDSYKSANRPRTS